ncbi:MAG: hypothetical protein AB7T06_08270 [Kofleriaceae bacterium]
MRVLIAAAVLLPSLASAQPGAAPVLPAPADTPAQPSTTSAEVLGLARGAHVAGVRGDCVGARVLAARAMRLDRDFYDAVISTDPSIAHCKPKPRVHAVDVEDPPVLQPAARPLVNPADGGRNVGGQLLLGTVMGAGMGIVGAFVGAAAIQDEDVPIGAILFGAIGVVAGTSAGVVLVGDNEGSDYSLGLTVVGSISGLAIAFKIAESSDIASPAVIALLVGAPTLGAMTGFNISRRTVYPTASTQVGVPAATRISDPTTSVPILAGSF